MLLEGRTQETYETDISQFPNTKQECQHLHAKSDAIYIAFVSQIQCGSRVYVTAKDVVSLRHSSSKQEHDRAVTQMLSRCALTARSRLWFHESPRVWYVVASGTGTG
jgi:glycerol-3-phosphate O-acyltransferase